MNSDFFSGLPFPRILGAALPSTRIAHRFLCTDTLGGKVAVVSADGRILWDFPCERPRDCWATPDGNYLFSHAGGVTEKLDDGRTLWEYVAESGSEISSCQPLPNGRYLVAENGPCRLVEVDTFGDVAKEYPLRPPEPVLEVDVPDRLRSARRSVDGKILVCRKGERVIEELDPDGKSLRRIPVGDVQLAVRLADGNLIVALGGGRKLQELDANLNVKWELGENDVPGNPLRAVSGFQRLANGNTLVCNELVPEFFGRQPQVFEITRDKKLVWEFSDPVNFKSISRIEIFGEKTSGADTGSWR